jgi:two-component system, NtrC family, sensor kinase
MKIFITTCMLFLLTVYAKSQSLQGSDSLRQAVITAANDSVRMEMLNDLYSYYIENNRDSALYFTEQAMVLAKKLKQPLWEARFLLNKAYIFQKEGNLPLVFKLINESLAITQDEKSEKNFYVPVNERVGWDAHRERLFILAGGFHNLGNNYSYAGNREKAIASYKEVIRISEQNNDKSHEVNAKMNIGSNYFEMNKLDSAMHYSRIAIRYANSTGHTTYLGGMLRTVGNVFFKQNQLDSAKYYYWASLSEGKANDNLTIVVSTTLALAKLYERIAETDSMFYYANAAYKIASGLKAGMQIASSAALISNAYKNMGETDSALTYLSISKQVRDSINEVRNEKLTEFQNLGFEEQMRLEKKVQENIVYKNKIRTIGLFSGLGILAALVLVFYRNNRQKQKANQILQEALSDLKSTQAQLIQSEKMASLGELTAGIAHEIQNPLNFVNNFSEVSSELVGEMVEEIDNGNKEEVKAIAKDLQQNLEKINHHGKRADAIVKGMLQHSQSSSGKKEPSDINALADEYLRLAYHGLRAKDPQDAAHKSFNATMKTDFDESIGNINIIPQDIGRVILNLITNAFYVVNEKAKQNIIGFEPTVEVSTKKEGNKVLVSVKDNGYGIPQNVLDKIFQPFFSTKPTGQGTGLGLSLSYDIVKAHGGELKVETKEGEGSTFIIALPVIA